jgi:glucokinase
VSEPGHPEHFLGIDLGGSTVRASLIDASGAILDQVRALLPDGPGRRQQAVLSLARSYRGAVTATGMAVAGTVRDGVLTWSPNLGLHDVPFARLLREETGVPAVLLNDAKAAGLAEARIGAGIGRSHVLVLTLGTGIGGALIHDGRLVRGTGDAGEVGHMRLWEDGVPCGCGRVGCWETRIGGRALERAAIELLGPGEDSPVATMQSLAGQGHDGARRIIESAARDFGRGVDALCAVLAPEVIVIGGGMAARRDLVVTSYLGQISAGRWSGRAEITLSSLGDDAGQLGAALHAVDLITSKGGIVL